MANFAKRGLDLCGALAALALTGPVIAGAAVAVAATMGRPVLFRQDRPGLHGKTFRLAKFRTMRHPRPGEEGPEADAARLTRTGRFLRATSIDELPTLLNVLRGDMSLVGPRPLLVRYLPRYSADQARRHDVRPGITGWAQVNGLRGETETLDKMRARVQYDIDYMRNWSLVFDLMIIAKTVAVVWRDQNAY